MQTVTELIMLRIEETRAKFKKDKGNPKDQKRVFINWYIEQHKAPINVCIYDLSNYYLHISEETIMTYLNEKK